MEHGSAQQGVAGHAIEALHGSGGYQEASRGIRWHCVAQQGTNRNGKALRGKALQGEAPRGLGRAWHWHGEAAQRGTARRGEALQWGTVRPDGTLRGKARHSEVVVRRLGRDGEALAR